MFWINHLFAVKGTFLLSGNGICFVAIVIQDVFHLFFWMCALGAAVAIPASLRKSAFAFLGWFALYFLIYWHLTSNGRYSQDQIAGRSRWMPAHCETSRIKNNREVPALNGMGAFFSPLVFFDRLLLHRPVESKPLAVGGRV